VTTWGDAELGDLHPDLRAIAPVIIGDADADGLDVRRQSGYRSNVRQDALYRDYLQKKAAFDRGELGDTPPIPAAPAGKSAHNYALCSRDRSHLIGAAIACPICGAGTLPASLCLDVSIHDERGNAIRTLMVPLDQRPAVWQRWAAILDRYGDEIRDGGDFKGRLDVVHFELIGWNVLDHTYRGRHA